MLLDAGTPLVFTSGVWVYGSAPPGEVLDEDSEPDPVRIYAWRPALEREVLDAGGIVIRPGMVYGRGGGPMNQFAEMADEHGVPRHVGDGRNHWSIVHVDDLADLYRILVEDAPAGTLVNGITGDPVEVRDLAAAACDGRRRAAAGRVAARRGGARARLHDGRGPDPRPPDQRCAGARAPRVAAGRAVTTRGTALR